MQTVTLQIQNRVVALELDRVQADLDGKMLRVTKNAPSMLLSEMKAESAKHWDWDDSFSIL